MRKRSRARVRRIGVEARGALRRSLWRLRPLPDFLIIGAQKAGTTSLYAYLLQHPLVKAATVKEVHFFDHQWHRGLPWYRSHFPLALRDSRSWMTGESSPFYLFHPEAPSRAKQVVPDARIIVILREPVERAYSHYHHERAKGREPLDDFAAAIRAEESRLADAWDEFANHGRSNSLESASYLSRGRYAEQLARWMDAYSADRILVVWAADLFERPRDVLNDVCRFLGLPPAPWTVDLAPRNARSYPPLPADLAADVREALAEEGRELERLLGVRAPWMNEQPDVAGD